VSDGMFVIIEWNQASHQPKVAADEVYDTRDEAESFAAEMRAAMATIGRRERFTVHELVEEGTTDGG
jgi:hypothetical protein